MNLNNGRGSMSTANSTISLKLNDGVSEFPAGLRVLVVDDDPTCLMILEKMLRTCFYEVTKCQRAEVALSILRESKTRFDIVISDVHMPDMDGFKLLEHIGLEMDLPVIMMSADDGKDVVMKGVTHGACDYLIKPIRIEALKNIWQHVVRKRRNGLEQSGSVEDGDRNRKPSEDATCASSENEGNWRNLKRKKDEEDEEEDRDDTSTLKKPRVVWSVNLHQQFVEAVNQLGIDKAVPKKILELMNVPGITRENVASHLQKYRLYLRRLSGVSQHQNGLNMPFMDPQEANLRPMPSLDGLDLQALATLQAGFGRSTANSGIGMPLVDQRNLFGSEMPILRFGEGQQMGNCSKQVNLLHELPTSMEPKQLAQFHQSVQTLGSMGLQVSEGVSGILKLPTPVRTTSSSAHVDSVRRVQSSSSLMQMAQPWSRGPVLNEIAGGHGSGLPSPIRQPIFSNEISGRALGRNGTLLNARGATHNPLSQASSMVNFPTNHVTEFPMNGSPLGSASGISTLTLTDVFQVGGNSEIKGSIGFAPSFDIFDELHQCKPQDWQLQDVGLQGNLDLLPSALSHQGFISSQKNGQNRNKTVVGKTMVSLGEEYENGNPENIAQRHSNLLINNSFRVKSESMPDLSCENVLFGEQFGQDDLMTALLKQQQEDGLDESEFNLDGYPMDNIPV